MSKAGNKKRRRNAQARYTAALRAWNEKVRAAREQWWNFEAIKWPNGSRFKAGTDRSKHLRGYWDRIEEIARELGGTKPRPLPRKQGLTTGALTTGHLTSGGLNTGHL